MAADRSARGQIIRNTLTGWGARLVKLVLALLLAPMLLSEYGKEGYAILVLYASVIGWSELADLGLRPALGRELAGARAADDLPLYAGLVSTSLVAYGALWVVLAGALWVAAPWLVRQLGLTGPEAQDQLALLRYYGTFQLAAGIIRPVAMAMLVGAGNFARRNQIDGANTLLQGGLLLAVLYYADWGLAGWVAVMATTQVFSTGQLIWAARSEAPWLRPSPSLARRTDLIRLLSLGGTLTLSQWARKIKYDADPLLIARYLSPGLVAAYKPGASLMAQARPLLTTLAGQLYPLATHYSTRGQDAALERLFVTSSRYTMLMVVPVVCAFTFYAHPVLDLWLGRQLGPADTLAAAQVLAAWAVVEYAVSLEGSSSAVALSRRRMGPFVRLDLAAAAVNLALSWALLVYTDLGLLAVVLPSAALELLVRPLNQWMAARMLGLSAGQLWRQVWWRPLAVTALAVAGTAAIRALSPTVKTLLDLLVQGGIVGVWCLLLIGSLGLEPAERQRLAGVIRGAQGRLGRVVGGRGGRP